MDPAPIEIERAEGVWLYAKDGEKLSTRVVVVGKRARARESRIAAPSPTKHAKWST